ncbi:MAG TPA: sigma-70 factor domain-containing protein, partial [Gemmataceae bacterium]|nr:sigma-70 factor domain-containing protein [Gemmataceae bacterium]
MRLARPSRPIGTSRVIWQSGETCTKLRQSSRGLHRRWMTPQMTRPRRTRTDAVQSPLETYLREINETALLSADEEKALAYRIEEGDSEARDRMVRANLRLVVN